MYAETIAANPNARFPWRLYLEKLQSGSSSFTPTPESSVCFLPFIQYLPQAAVISVPIALQANPLVVFWIGRLGMYVLGVVLLAIAYRNAPREHKAFILVPVLLPTLHFQLSSYSKNAIHIAMGILSFSLMTRYMSSSVSLTPHRALSLLVAVGAAILTRPQIALLAGFFLYMPRVSKQIATLTAGRKWAGVLIFFTACAVVVAAVYTATFYIQKSVVLYSISSLSFVDPKVQVQNIQNRPDMLLPTVSHKHFLVRLGGNFVD